MDLFSACERQQRGGKCRSCESRYELFRGFYLTDEDDEFANECLFSDSYYANALKGSLYRHRKPPDLKLGLKLCRTALD